jgi:hypothetical protein
LGAQIQKPERPAARKKTMVGLSLQLPTNKASIGRKAALGLPPSLRYGGQVGKLPL